MMDRTNHRKIELRADSPRRAQTIGDLRGFPERGLYHYLSHTRKDLAGLLAQSFDMLRKGTRKNRCAQSCKTSRYSEGRASSQPGRQKSRRGWLPPI
jgi:hypothetical protein